MSTNSLISQLIAEKKAARYLGFLHTGIFLLTALYVVLYEMVLVEIPAINHTLYAIGKIIDGVAEAVVTGYIFYFFTEIIPEKSRKRSAKPIIEYQKAQLASQLDCLMQVLLKDNNWKAKNNLELKANYDEVARGRRIWTEKCSGLLEDDAGVVHYQPTTLFCIDLLMQRISDSIDMEHRLKPSTVASKKWLIDLKVTPFFKKIPLNEIKPTHVRQWQNSLTSYRDENGKPYSQIM